MLIIDEPTRGIDVGTKAEVHRLMSELAGEGLAVLMISLRAARGARDGRPRAGHARGPDRRASSRRDEADEESVVRAATGRAVAA